jgi:hypothetical protein
MGEKNVDNDGEFFDIPSEKKEMIEGFKEKFLNKIRNKLRDS